MTRICRRKVASFRRSRSYCPRLEMMESRCLPSTVTNLNDAGSGSLRDAIATTPSGGTVDFQAGLGGTIILRTGELAIAKNLTIAGPGADVITVSGNGASRIFEVVPGLTLGISGMSLVDGSAINADGGGILNDGTLTVTNCTLSGNSAVAGGGIFNYGAVTVSNSTISGNTAFNDDHTGNGGGIFNFRGGTLTVTNSTFRGNAVDYYGGAIYNFSTLTVTNSTLSGNGAGVGGGAIANYTTLTMTNSTVSGNSARDGGGLFNDYATSRTVKNSIFAGNTATRIGPDLYGDLGSQGYNLIGNTQGGSGFLPTDLLNVDPLLGRLQNNGGSTPTMTLLPGSPALNAGDPAQLGVVDQRGVVRHGAVNIGAYQASASAFLVSAPAKVKAGAPFDVTVTAVDALGQVAVGYTGTVTFGTSDPDPGVVLPADYPFTLADAGRHTFSDTGVGETTLLSHGYQTLTVSDATAGSVVGSVIVKVKRTRHANSLGGGIAPGQAVVAEDRFFASLRVRDFDLPPARSKQPGLGEPNLWEWDRLAGIDVLSE